MAGTQRLPEGWARVTLSDILSAPAANGRSVRSDDDGFPVLRLTALKDYGVDCAEYKLGDWTAEEAAPYLVRPGNFLVSRASGSLNLVGRGALVTSVPEPVAYPDTMIRIPTNPEHVEPRFLAYLWNSPIVRRQIERAARTGTGINKVSQGTVQGVKLPLPPRGEQGRIADALDERLARLGEITQLITQARSYAATLRKKILLDAIPEPADWPEDWQTMTAGQAGIVDLGRARHPDWHDGPKMRPYLRVANVFEDRIDITSLMEMDFSEGFGKYRLLPGDILLNEGQSPHLVGRPAMYKGIPEGVAFTNSLLRFRAGDEVLPGWALLVFRRHLHAGRFMQEVRITTNIAHLSTSRLKTVEFPVPTLDEQRRLVAETKGRLARVDALDLLLNRAEAHTTALRRAFLAEAFAGKLVSQDPDDEPAEDLLKRIRAEREAAEAERKATRRAAAQARRKSRGAAEQPPSTVAPPPAPTSETPLPEGEQTTLPLEFTE